MNPTVHAGTWTELIVVPENVSIARKPESVELATAAAAPLTAITAMSAIDALAIGQGDTLLVIGATPAGSAASPSSSPPPQGRP